MKHSRLWFAVLAATAFAWALPAFACDHKDQAAAASWYRKAANQNHLMAQVYLGALLYSGEGVKRDYVEAAHWLQTPADNGNDLAQFYLGVMYGRGDGVEQDQCGRIGTSRRL